jgi:hypothetical protein
MFTASAYAVNAGAEEGKRRILSVKTSLTASFAALSFALLAVGLLVFLAKRRAKDRISQGEMMYEAEGKEMDLAESDSESSNTGETAETDKSTDYGCELFGLSFESEPEEYPKEDQEASTWDHIFGSDDDELF